MTQFSGLWTTTSSGAVGHQVAGYTQAQWATFLAIIAACSGKEGVAPGYESELACSDGGLNTVDVAPGGALVDGKVYHNDAVEAVNIPSAVGGGNTRIDRIVLRADWAGFDVAITRIAGTDAASPTAPAIVQTSGTIYDIMLCQVLVDTSGNVTVTDERVWAIIDTDGSTLEDSGGALRVKSDGINNTHLRNSTALSVIGRAANSAGDPADIAAGANDRLLARVSNTLSWVQLTSGMIPDDIVDDTKVGNRVPQFSRRKGGNATSWATAGSTSYAPTAVRMQAGVTLVLFTGQDNSAQVVTFPLAFSAAPIVFVSVTGPVSRDFYVRAYDAQADKFYVSVKLDASFSGNVETAWLAIGPE